MNKLKRLPITLVLVFFSSFLTHGQQTNIDLEFRMNPVYSAGFRMPLFEGDRPSLFTMQRSRLNITYNDPDNISSQIILQDRRAWGETNVRQDAPEVAIFRAWVEKSITPDISLKLGRQGFVYDDQYLLGELNWGGTMVHDGVVFKYTRPTFQAHLATSYSTNKINEFKREPYLRNYHKTMSFLWFKKDWKKLSIANIALLKGMEDSDTTINFTITFGSTVDYKLNDNFSFKGVYYHQLGENQIGQNVDANFWVAEIKYTTNAKYNFAVGIQSVSGSDMASNVDSNTSNGFDRHYALLHRHLGWIDYFYVAVDPVFGVVDSYFNAQLKLPGKITIDNQVHSFYSQQTPYAPTDLSTSYDRSLGIENDFRIKKVFNENFKGSMGISKMWGTETLDMMFGDEIKSSHFIYAVLNFNLNILSHNHNN